MSKNQRNGHDSAVPNKNRNSLMDTDNSKKSPVDVHGGPRDINGVSPEAVRKSPPKPGKTTQDALGVTWGEASPGIVVSHN